MHKTRLQLAIEHVLDRHADVDLAGADQVHDDAEAVEGAEYAREEAVRDALAVRLDVQHDDALLDRHCRREPFARRSEATVGVHSSREDAVDDGGGRRAKVGQRGFRLEVRLWIDDRTPAAWVFDVLDAYGDFPPDDLVSVFYLLVNTFSRPVRGHGACLFHRKWVDDLAAVVGQLGSLFGRDDRDEARSDYFARVCCEDSVDFFPYLQLGCPQTRSQQRSCQVGIPATHLF